jgi:cyclic pyranopterin phosphate synthase
MPAEGIKWKSNKLLLTFEEITRLAEIFVEMGITKIRLTGGEPLVRKNLEILVARLRKIQGLQTLAMTTNATLLAEKAGLLRQAGLDDLNISLDSFKRERFLEVTRRDDLAKVLAGIDQAFKANFRSLKLNVVVMAGFNDDEVMDFADFANNNKVNVRFIEYMPFKDNGWTKDKVITFSSLRSLIETKYKLHSVDSEPSAVAKDFAIEKGKGSVSFISSMSDSFCSTCNRVRLTSDGSIKSCLFYPAETSLRDAMRNGLSDQDLRELIARSMFLKPEAHPPAEEIATADNRTMIEIGG